MNSKSLLMISVCVMSFAAGKGYAFDSVKVIDSVVNQTSSRTILVSEDPFLKGAENFIDAMANDAIGFLGNSKLTEAQKAYRFRKLLQAKFDMKTIGRFALGRYWRVSSPAQQKTYQKLFEEMVVDVYASRFGEYQGQDFEVRSSRKDSERDVTVQSVIVSPNGPDIRVDWRVRKKDGRYRVIDVGVEGVSMGLTQRSEFASVIQRGGGQVDVLLAHLSGE